MPDVSPATYINPEKLSAGCVDEAGSLRRGAAEVGVASLKQILLPASDDVLRVNIIPQGSSSRVKYY